MADRVHSSAVKRDAKSRDMIVTIGRKSARLCDRLKEIESGFIRFERPVARFIGGLDRRAKWADANAISGRKSATPAGARTNQFHGRKHLGHRHLYTSIAVQRHLWTENNLKLNLFEFSLEVERHLSAQKSVSREKFKSSETVGTESAKKGKIGIRWPREFS